MRRRERDLRQVAEDHGWTLLGQLGGSHYKLAGPRGERIAVASTTCNWRADMKLAALLRRLNAGRAGAIHQ